MRIKKSFQKQILISFMLINISILSISYLMFYIKILKTEENQIQKNQIKTVTQSRNYLEHKFKGLENNIQMLSHDSYFQELLKTCKEGDCLDEKKQIEKHILHYNIAQDVYNVRVFVPNPILKTSNSNKIFSDQLLKDRVDLPKEFVKKHRDIFWTPTYKIAQHGSIETQNIVSILKPVYLQKEYLGTVVYDVLEQNLFTVFENTQNLKSETSLIIDSNYIIISNFEKDKLGTVFNHKYLEIESALSEVRTKGSFRSEVKQYNIYAYPIETNDWFVITFISKEDFIDKKRSLFLSATFSFILSGILIAIISYRISKSLSFRINQIEENTRGFVENKLFREKQIMSPHDELDSLEKNIQKMMRELELLLQKEYENKVLLGKIDLKLLEKQINPHFLYNVLDLIRWEALDKNQYHLARMSKELSQFYRTSLSESQWISLGQEISHIESYLKIQNYRFNDVILVKKIDSSCLNFMIPKLLLQPIVENAYLHGIRPLNTKGTIKIIIYEEVEYVSISILNNGKDIEKDIFQKIKSGNYRLGFGLFSVYFRLTNIFKDESLISVEKNYPSGAIFTVRIPKNHPKV